MTHCFPRCRHCTEAIQETHALIFFDENCEKMEEVEWPRRVFSFLYEKCCILEYGKALHMETGTLQSFYILSLQKSR